MKPYRELTKEELVQLKTELEAKYKEAQAKDLHLDMSRGKPSADQLDLSMPMLDVLNSESDLKDSTGLDCRNYGVLDGLKDAAENRVQSQEKAFDGYGTNQMKLLANAVIETKGNYLFYCVAENPGKYEEVFRHAVQ